MAEAGTTGRSSKALRLVLGCAGLVFVLVAAREVSRDFDPSSVVLDPLLFVLSIPFALLATWVQSSAWLRLLDAWTGSRLARPSARALYFAAQVARYTPGKLGLPAVRMAGASAIGVSAQVMGSTLLLEVLAWCTTGGSICGLVLVLYPEVLGALGLHLAGLMWLGFGSGVALLCAFIFVPRRFVPRRLGELLHLSGSGPLMPASVIAFYCVHWSSWIAHGTLLGMALGASLERAVLVGVALVLGIVAGFLAFLAPAGAGVREAVIATTAIPVLGPAGALTAGLLARGLSLGIDVLYWALGARWAARSLHRVEAP